MIFKSDKNELSNLEVSLRKEFICVSDNGSYASTTLSGCNSRKYHGLYVCPQPALNQDNFVLLSSLEETVCQQDKEFHIGVKRYAGHVFSPKGHKYIESFEYLTHPVWYYRVGGVLLRKELLMHAGQNRLLIKYTLVEAHSETSLEIRPFLAFRDVHELTVCNDTACTQVQYAEKGIKCRLYPSFSSLYIQTSRSCRITDHPDWYRQVEYVAEKERGYHCREDLFTPGTLSVPLTLNEPVVLSVGLTPLAEPETSLALFAEGQAALTPMDNMENSLRAAAESFIIHKEDRCQIVAGYPWFGSWGRDTFISIPGLMLCAGKTEMAADVLRSMRKDLSGGLFPNVGYGGAAAYNSADAPLWFVWAVQQYAAALGDLPKAWEEFGDTVKQVIEKYAAGIDLGIGMTADGLIYAGKDGCALTWMDAMVDGKAITPRQGMPVEINALWYNAVMFALEAEKACGKETKDFSLKWRPLMDNFPAVFKACFWNKEKGYLADVVCNDNPDWSVRPNQIIAVSMPYSPVSEKVGQLIVEKVKNFLLTPRGLRSLAPADSRYKSIYRGNQSDRDHAYHQGTVWVWPVGHFAEAYLRVYGKEGKPFVEELYRNFEPALWEAGIGTVSEIYDGDPPYKAQGAFSQAWSVAELLRIRWMLDSGKYDKR